MARKAKAVWLGGALVALAALGWYGFGADSDADAAVGSTRQLSASLGPAQAASQPVVAGSGPYSAAGLQSRQEQLVLWRGRYERAEQIYASYRDATRYPYDSRPIAEHPDQVRPFAPIAEELKLRNANGEEVKGLRLRTSQERVFLSGSESVKFTVAVRDENDRPLPLVIRNARAQSIPDSRTPIQLVQTSVAFSDDGASADDASGDGTYSGRLTPASQGFQNFGGTIRLLVELAADGKQGVVHFDVVYVPDVPATWTGVREALEAGSLNFYLKAQVRQAGRYVVSARVDDANDVPFALLQFNDEVAAGSREFKLQVFGALVLDKSPAFPLRLRDVDGFLLIPDKFPDRSTMARQAGVVHVSASYPKSRFSPAEWSSEERQRYLAEYGKDAETARRQVEELSSR
ncbi:hypothetical protein HZ993_20090 [Rhodoferax sp. AJA081-3]|uniref:hypothetical protein n=1 Tax=Rhodoferax sp. AJA081-3 TaxID=2752316 RepID=UPI001ADF2CB3|nr:hypothetical protein [Rhodoferax sp. AJA081-3]QTN27543.1 hypothetical protein HZ993_20090 [Rhodoferax sp. AJA081-3]